MSSFLFYHQINILRAFYIENLKKMTGYDIAVTILSASFNIVAYLLKVRIVEPDKQPLLANGSETTFVSRHRARNRQRNCWAADGRC
jgi:hypothetical protein